MSDCYKYYRNKQCYSITHNLTCSQGKELKMRIGANTAKLEAIVTFALALVVTSPVVMAAIAVI